MKLRHNFIALMFGTLLLVPLRTYQLFYAIDPATGFYISTDIFVPVFTLLLLVTVAFQIVTGFFARVKERAWKDFDGPVIGVLSFILASAFTVMSFFSLMPESIVNSRSFLLKLIAPLRSLFFAEPSEQILNRPDALLFVQGLFGLLSGVFFIIISYNCFSSKKIKTPVLLVLSPVIFSCVRLAYSFMGFTSIANLSEHLFDVLMLVFSTLFFYYLAKYIYDMDRNKAVNRLFAFGSPAVIFCFICTIPRYLRLMFGAYDGTELGSPNFFVGFPNLFNLIAPMFFIAALFYILTIRISDTEFFDGDISDNISFEFDTPIVINRFVAGEDQQDSEEGQESINKNSFEDFDDYEDDDDEYDFFGNE